VKLEEITNLFKLKAAHHKVPKVGRYPILLLLYTFQTPISKNSQAYTKLDNSSFLSRLILLSIKKGHLVGNIQPANKYSLNISSGKMKTCIISNASNKDNSGLLPPKLSCHCYSFEKAGPFHNIIHLYPNL